MAYVLTDGSTTVVTYPYSIGLLRGDNPNVSFPASPDNTLLADWNVFPVTDVAQPSYDVLTERVEEGTPTFDGTNWNQTWNVITLTAPEQATVLAEFQLAAEQQANALYNATNEYLDRALTETIALHPDMVQYRTDLINFTSLPGYPANITWPTFPTNIYGTSGELPIDTYTKSEADVVIATKVDSATPNVTGELNMNNHKIIDVALPSGANDAATKRYVDGQTFNNRTIYIEPESGSSTANTLFADALATVGSTSLYRIYVGSGVYNEPGPINITGKNQLNVIGPDAAGTTSATIAAGVTIDSPAGNRFSHLRFGGTVGLNIAAGLGTYFNKVQFGSAVTIMGMGGFIIFDECDFESNITIDPAFAGQVYINRSAFSGASAVYNFQQPLAAQVIISDTTGIPNAGIAKAAYSGIITKKNNVQNLYLNNTKFITLNGTESGPPVTGDALVYNSTTGSWAPNAPRDTTKLPTAGGSMTGALNMNTSIFLNFKTTANTNVSFQQRNDESFVFSSTDNAGNPRQIFNVYANSATSPLSFAVPIALSGTITANSSVGSAGQVLTSSGTGVYWSTPAGGGGSVPAWNFIGSHTGPGSTNLAVPDGLDFTTFAETYTEYCVVATDAAGGQTLSTVVPLVAIKTNFAPGVGVTYYNGTSDVWVGQAITTPANTSNIILTSANVGGQDWTAKLYYR